MTTTTENNFAIFIENFVKLSIDDRINKYREILFDVNHEFYNRTTELLDIIDDAEDENTNWNTVNIFSVIFRKESRLESHIIKALRESLLEGFDNKKYDFSKVVALLEELRAFYSGREQKRYVLENTNTNTKKIDLVKNNNRDIDEFEEHITYTIQRSFSMLEEFGNKKYDSSKVAAFFEEIRALGDGRDRKAFLLKYYTVPLEEDDFLQHEGFIAYKKRRSNEFPGTLIAITEVM